jgi:hypothetical protein
MADQDAVAQWQAFTAPQRAQALQRMTPEQKNWLKGQIESAAHPKGSPIPGATTIGPMSEASRKNIKPAAMETPHSAQYLTGRASGGLEKALPSVIAGVGALYGGPGGAAVGGAVGQGIENKMETGSLHPGSAIGEGIAQGAMEFVGGKLVPKALAKIAAKASPRAAQILNSYIGLTKGALPKFGRTVQNALDVGKTVLEKVGVKPTLEAQRAAIETARQAYDDTTKKIVASPGGRLTDIHSVMWNRAVKLLDQMEKEGVPQEQIRAIDKNLQGVLDATKKGHLMPDEVHALRREIQKQITNWNPLTTDVRQRFLQGIYHDMNDAITRALPPGASRAFLQANKIQSRLITARQAADETLLKQATKSTTGAATKIAKTVGGAAVGATAGGIAGGESGHGRVGAVTGAVIGAAGGAAHAGVGSINLPRADVAISKAAAKILSARTAKVLGQTAKATPQTVRAYQAVKDVVSSIQSRPQNQP